MKESLIEGTFLWNEKGFGFISVNEAETKDIFVARKNVNGAISGDTVSAKILVSEQAGKRAEGKIIKILKHEKEEVVGIFQKSKTFAFVTPDNKKLGTDIFIQKKGFGGARNNDKVLVKITKYPEKGKNAEGRVIEVLGNINVAGVDMLSLVKEYELPYEFPNEVMQKAETIETAVSEKDLKNRKDFRGTEIFTIDGADSKDLDDAISVSKTKEGTYLLNVHIADVSHYVQEGDAIDQEAVNRGTSIYMLDRVIPMLPQKLSNGICSLNAGEDRLTLSVCMEIDQKGNIVSGDIDKGVIQVTERLTYDFVYQVLKGEQSSSYRSHFQAMEALSVILKKKRERFGELNLNLPESKIILDENGRAIDIKKYDYTAANTIIEQFMVTANEFVAEKFYWLTAPFIYRTHEIPDSEKIAELSKVLHNLGYKMKAAEEQYYGKAFAEVLQKALGTKEERVISDLVLRTLKLAKYSSENKGHFGLASKYYCHFTSPIRRYPDLFIHRMISTYLKNKYQVSEQVKEKYAAIASAYADLSSEKERRAEKAERDAENLKKAEYMEDKVGEEYEAFISGVTSFGIFVQLENTVEGLVKFDHLGDDYYVYNDKNKTLYGERKKELFKIGDKIQVKLLSANKLSREIDFQRI